MERRSSLVGVGPLLVATGVACIAAMAAVVLPDALVVSCPGGNAKVPCFFQMDHRLWLRGLVLAFGIAVGAWTVLRHAATHRSIW
jgi:hypothetical protein